MTKRVHIIDLVKASGDFERYCDASWRLPEKVEVVERPESTLAWRPGDKERRVTRGLLERFIELREASPRKIAAFARRAGMLELHDEHINWAPGKPRDPEELREARAESVADWRAWAVAAWAALDITAHLKSGSRPPATDWPMLFRPALLWSNLFGYHSPDTLPFWDPDADASFLEHQINRFLEIGRVRPILDWDQGMVRYRVRGLLGAIALQLLLIATGAESWVICSGCARPYQPLERAPKSGQRAFCPTCRRSGAPERIAAKDYRARVKSRTRY
jgi:hypothetical protein